MSGGICFHARSLVTCGAVAVAMLAAGCGGGSNTGAGTTASTGPDATTSAVRVTTDDGTITEPVTETATTETATETATTETATDTGTETTATATTTPTTESRTPSGNLVASPDNVRCDFVPNGMLDGSDELSVAFFVLLIGADPSELPGLVEVTAGGSNGMSAHVRTAVTNRGATVLQFSVPGSAFGTSPTFTITVDPADEVPESDETDNRISVTVSLPPARPDTARDLPCSARRA